MAKILIVDDRPTNRQLLLTLLSYGGHELLEAADGAEALQRVHDNHPDLVITDILMPTMSGYEFVQHLRTDAKLGATPVIFYTASYSEPQAAKLALSCDVKIVLPKPCEPERVLAAVNEALNLGQAEQLPQAAKQRVATAAREAMLAEHMLSDYLRDLNAVRRGFVEIIEHNDPQPIDRVQMEELSSGFSKTIAGLSLMTARLSTLVQAGLDLLQDREAKDVVRHCFDAACGVVGSEYAAIGVFDQQESALKFLFVKGLDPHLFDNGGRELPLLAALLEQRQSIRIKSDMGTVLSSFSAAHPPVSSFLGVPIATTENVYGWMYFANRIGATEFSEEDARVAATLAMQLALLHENFVLYDMLQNHSVQLQLEIAERRHAERELLRLNETLEARVAARTTELRLANKELEAYSYSVSHDLRAPLTTIAGFVKLLTGMDTQDAASGERKTFLQHIETATQRTISIIDALLRLSQLGRQELSRSTVDLSALVAEVLQQLRMQEPGRQIDVQLEALPTVVGDTAMLKQLYVNLLSNAFKFTRQCAAAKIDIGCYRQQHENVYFVTDNGVGFNPLHAERLFAAFQRDHSEAQYEGSGIGLSIVQRIVQRHGGRVWAEAKPSAGATFCFTLAEPPLGVLKR